MFNTKNGRLRLHGAVMDYILFGKGEKDLVMIPGLGDGLLTVRGKALPFSLMYTKYAKAFRVWMFSRPDPLPQGHTTRDMARDLKDAMVLLGIEKASVIGISQGGMIAQHLAIDYPEKVEKLVLTVTVPCANEVLTQNVQNWMEMARRDDYAAIMEDNLRQMYTEAYVKKNRWLLPITTRVGKPKSFDRFLVQAEACLTHDAASGLGAITAPTLILGGGQDRTLGVEGSYALQEAIPNSRLRVWEDYGHALYDEAPDFDDVVLGFLQE
ncbi:MAG: alpha/beta hydrolase [Clostridia bacterium]|nr:alpha/beta hydrolase [Clostridia bacterium]